MAEEIIPKEVVYALLAVIVVIAAIAGCSKIYGAITESNEKQQALGTLDNFISFLSDIPENQASSFLIYSPKGDYLTFTGASVCICDKTDCSGEKTWCKDVSKPIESDSKAIKIELGTLVVTNNPQSYFVRSNLKTEDTSDEGVNLLSDKCYGNLVDVGGGFQLRESVKPVFEEAQRIARESGVNLILTSAYRDYAVQKQMWDNSGDTTLVCNPDSPERQGGNMCPHMTGCAVDVFTKSLFGMPANTNNADTRALEQIMVKAGFVRYKNEFWHFEYGTSRWQTCETEKTDVC